MDVYYISDSMHYGSFRNPLYRDYEKFPYGTLENPLNSPPKSTHHKQQQQQQRNGSYNMAQEKSKNKSSKEPCPFCKEQKKRPLGAYMRKRGQRITSESISEDVEEDQEERECGPETSPAGSPTNTELASHNHHHHVHGRRNLSRQNSQDSDGK
ncbi:uncharacterized protein LOC131678554 [Topomyia yanbarensis]|uniref:uncharacterized protein LOC131678554 n=1 Tax=Topomyia yanbarensis TaxID=2498891 RepID=UPI00273CB2F5|nr:uncharacterized protein LOC131678554 [Topomyia yanbarensis]